MKGLSGKVGKFIFSLPEYVCWVLLILLIILNFSGVIFRYCLNNPFTFGEEATKFLFVWLVMLGTAHTARRDKHVHLDFLTSKLPHGFQKALQILTIVAEIFLYIFLVVLAIRLCTITTQRTAIFKVNYRYIYSSVAVSGVYFIWYMGLRLIRASKEQPQDLNLSAETRLEGGND